MPPTHLAAHKKSTISLLLKAIIWSTFQDTDTPMHLLKNYLSGRATLRRAFVLIDTRHGVKEVDEEIMKLLDRSAVTFQCVMTKADKVKLVDREKILDQTRRALSKHPAAYPELVLTSSEKGDGIETLRSIIYGLE